MPERSFAAGELITLPRMNTARAVVVHLNGVNENVLR